ncbi:MAG: hypothetical protein AB7E52_02090 [Bdellovibrionales bacterium]
MRFMAILVVGVLSSLSLSASATVLLPDKNNQPNLGLVPRQKSVTKESSSTPAATKVPAPSVSTSSSETKDSAIDTVNRDVLKSMKASSLLNVSESDLRNMSESQIQKLMADQLPFSERMSLQKYIKKDPATGGLTVDFDQMQRDIAARGTKPIVLKPGGTLAKDTRYSVDDAQAISKFLNKEIAWKDIKRKRVRPPFLRKPPSIYPDKGFTLFTLGQFTDSLGISVQPGYIWGAKDADLITEYFGYEGDLIPQNCQIRLDLTLHTDDGEDMYNVTLMAGENETVPYAGVLQSVEARPYAVCNRPAGDLPLTGHIIFDYRGKLAAMLSKASCDVVMQSSSSKPKPPSSVVVQYVGDSKVSCTFMK